MAWGVPAPASAPDDLLAKAQRSTTLCVMPFRRFGPDECAALCDGLADDSPLVELLASGHAIGEAGARAAGRLLARHATLRRLALGDALFGDAGVEALVAGLGEEPSCRLEVLLLDFKALGEPGARAVAALLERTAALRELTLARNPQLLRGDGGVRAMAGGLRAAAALEQLDLSETGLVGGGGVEQLSRAAQAGALRALRSLRLSRNALGPDGAAAVGGALLPALPALRECWLEECALEASGAAALGTGAAAARGAGVPLEALHLDRNAAAASDAASVRALAAAAAAGLTTLHLGSCGLGDDEAADELGAARGLTALDLHSNQLGARAAAALGRLGGLRSLRLFDNPMGDAAALGLVRGLGAASALTSLDLGGCRLSQPGTRALCDELLLEGVLPQLRCIELFGNECDADTITRLREARPALDVAWKSNAEQAEKDEADDGDDAQRATGGDGGGGGGGGGGGAMPTVGEDQEEDDDAPPGMEGEL